MPAVRSVGEFVLMRDALVHDFMPDRIRHSVLAGSDRHRDCVEFVVEPFCFDCPVIVFHGFRVQLG